jgi:hypothetical protein
VFEINFQIEGFEELGRALRSSPELFNLAVEDAAKSIRNLVIGRTPVDSGELKGSWSPVQRTSTGFTFGTDKDYADILEEGRYTSVGPRTVAVSGGIFSRQAPGGMIAPVLADEAIMSRVTRRVAEELVRGIARAT